MDRHADGMAVAVDAKDGFLVEKGWTVVTRRKATDLVRELAVHGVPTTIFTAGRRPGACRRWRRSWSLEAVARAFGGDTIYAGGVATLEDIAGIAKLRHRGVRGVIVGRALYSGAFTLAQALEVAANGHPAPHAAPPPSHRDHRRHPSR